jgi:uncharacterized membrane protein YkvA (DUF1232 family)
MAEAGASEQQAKEELEKRARMVKDEDVRRVLAREQEIREKFEGNGPLGKFIGDLKLLFGIVGDYWNGAYREVPWYTIAAIVAALLYVLSPVDMIPDFIPVFGYLDDAAVVAWCLYLVRTDLSIYKEWKVKNG